MTTYFKDIVDVDFTAQLEERLNQVKEEKFYRSSLQFI